jgi:hypothetical protein
VHDDNDPVSITSAINDPGHIETYVRIAVCLQSIEQVDWISFDNKITTLLPPDKTYWLVYGERRRDGRIIRSLLEVRGVVVFVVDDSDNHNPSPPLNGTPNTSQLWKNRSI